MNKLQENLHHVFVPIGLLFGFVIFAVAAVVDPLAGVLAYLLFFLPAFFGGIYSGEDRADDSAMLDVLGEMVDDMFKFGLNDIPYWKFSMNQLLAITTTFFYFAFWMILGIALDIPGVIGHLFQWVLPSYLFGLLSNKNIFTPVISFIQTRFQKLMRIL